MPFSRLRALGPMLTPSARERRPFFVRFVNVPARPAAADHPARVCCLSTHSLLLPRVYIVPKAPRRALAKPKTGAWRRGTMIPDCVSGPGFNSQGGTGGQPNQKVLDDQAVLLLFSPSSCRKLEYGSRTLKSRPYCIRRMLL